MADPRFGTVMLGKSYLDIIKQINANFAQTDTDLLAVETKAGEGTEALDKKLSALIETNTTNIAANTKAIGDNKADIEGKLETAKSDLEAEIAKKATKATTLAGYGITDAKIEAGASDDKKKVTLGTSSVEVLTEASLAPYAKSADVNTEIGKVNKAIEDAKTALRDGLVKVVTAVPTVDNAEAGVIYLVANGATEGNDLYTEYVLVVKDGVKSIEKLGDLKLVLDDYATKATLTTELAKKVDKVDGKGLSDQNFTKEEKDKLAGIAEKATRVLVDSAMSDTSVNAVQNKVVDAAIKAAQKAAESHADTEVAKKDAAKQLAVTVNDFGTAADGVYTATVAAKGLYPTGIVTDSTGLARLVDVQKVNDNIVVKSMEAFAGNILVTTIH